MSYELRFPPDTKIEIATYIAERFEGKRSQEAAADAIIAELEKLETNPGLGSSKPGGPFENRPIYRFAIHGNDGVTHYIEVAYKVHKNDRVIVISGFRPVAF